MTTTTAPQVTLTRTFDASRAQVWKAFTDPDQFIAWWGPFGNKLPREDVDFDIRSGGHMSWSEHFPDDPNVRTNGRVELSEVVDTEVLDGLMSIQGQLPQDYKAFETRMRVEFYDEPDGKTRVEVRQWLREDYAEPTINGWGEAFSKLDATLSALPRA